MNASAAALEPERSMELLTETSERIADGALEQFTDFGIRRTSVEDIARRADLSRATVYRSVGSKDDVIRLVMAREAQRAMSELDLALAGEKDPGVSIEIGFAFLVRFVGDHPLFDRLLRTESETLLPFLTVEGGPFLGFYRSLIAERWEEMRDAGAIAPANLERAADAAARLAISLVLTPSSVVDAGDPEAVALFAREVLLPMLRPRSSTSKSREPR